MAIYVTNETESVLAVLSFTYMWLPTPSLFWSQLCILQPGESRDVRTWHGWSKLFAFNAEGFSEGDLTKLSAFFMTVNVCKGAISALGGQLLDQSWLVEMCAELFADSGGSWLVEEVMHKIVEALLDEAYEELLIAHCSFKMTYGLITSRRANVEVDSEGKLSIHKIDWLRGRRWFWGKLLEIGLKSNAQQLSGLSHYLILLC